MVHIKFEKYSTKKVFLECAVVDLAYKFDEKFTMSV